MRAYLVCTRFYGRFWPPVLLLPAFFRVRPAHLLLLLLGAWRCLRGVVGAVAVHFLFLLFTFGFAVAGHRSADGPARRAYSVPGIRSRCSCRR